MTRWLNKTALTCLPWSLLLAAGGAQAELLYDKDGRQLGLEVESMVGAFRTSEDYLGEGGKSWREGYLKATLTGQTTLSSGATLRGGLGGITLGTWGDGDAGGYTVGGERRTKIENAYVGWASAGGGLDLSFGRQQFQLGDGFLIASDPVSIGKGFAPLGVQVNRGGAYYLAGQKSFDRTAIARFDPAGPLRGDAFWLKSDNPYQQNTELAGLNVEHVDEQRGTLGASYLKILDVDRGAGLGLWDQRDGMNVYSVRGQGSLGVENLFLSFEYVAQRGGRTAVKNHANAWYVEGGWTFAQLPWQPNLNYRHARFSADKPGTARNEAFDPLFFGMTRGFGTWFQGEVASNYAGPANSGNRVDRLELTLNPREDLSIGLQYWDIRREGQAADLAGREIDLFAMWQINDNVIFSPMVGWYKPRGADVIAAQGNDKRNLYLQAVLMFFY